MSNILEKTENQGLNCGEVLVNIRNIAVGGAGVGEVIESSEEERDLLGISTFIPFTAIGEQVKARIIRKKKKYLEAELLEIVSGSEERVVPSCDYFTRCGACELQHLSYVEQLESKFQLLRGSMQAARISAEDVEKLEPVVPSSPYGFRRRLTLHIDSSGRVGFYRASSRSVVPIKECPIANDQIAAVLGGVQDFGAAVAKVIGSLTLEADSEGVVAVLKSTYDLAQQEMKSVLETSRKFFSDAVLISNGREAGGYGRQILKTPLNQSETFYLRVPAGHFSQTNQEINLKLIEEVIQHLEPKRGQLIWDLYAGAGNFSFPLARQGGRLVSVEADKKLAFYGQDNAKRLGYQKTVDFVELSVEKFLKEGRNREPEAIIADPPRSGLSGLCSKIPKVEKLVLISCHQPSFIRDLKTLLDNGWQLELVKPFDMFAQTSYLEILSVFTPSSD